MHSTVMRKEQVCEKLAISVSKQEMQITANAVYGIHSTIHKGMNACQ